MKIRHLFLTLFSLICFSTVAQQDAFQEQIIMYLDETGNRAQYSEIYDGVFVVLQKNFKEEVPEEVWVDISGDKETRLDALRETLAGTYRNYFSEAEIAAINEFYTSPAARQMDANSSALTEKQEEEVATFNNSELGKKMVLKRTTLSEDAKLLAEDWRKTIFIDKMGTLVKLGYRNQ